jgi:hypothetical protein
MNKELMNELQSINLKLNYYLDILGNDKLSIKENKTIQSTIESLKDRKSSLNAFRLS